MKNSKLSDKAYQEWLEAISSQGGTVYTKTMSFVRKKAKEAFENKECDYKKLATTKEISTQTGNSMTQIKNILNEAEANGEVVKIKTGNTFYWLPTSIDG